MNGNASRRPVNYIINTAIIMFLYNKRKPNLKVDFHCLLLRFQISEQSTLHVE